MTRQPSIVPAPAPPVIVRALRPQDVDAVVGLHCRAFPGFFLTVLGPRFLREFYRRFADQPSAIAVVAVDPESGGLVGFAVGASNPRGFYRQILQGHWWRFALAALPTVIRHPSCAGRVARALQRPGESRASAANAELFSIAVNPLEQGRAVGRALLEQFLAHARDGGCYSVSLTTDADDNAATNAFYARRGFTLRRSYVTPEGRHMHEYEFRWEVS